MALEFGPEFIVGRLDIKFCLDTVKKDHIQLPFILRVLLAVRAITSLDQIM